MLRLIKTNMWIVALMIGVIAASMPLSVSAAAEGPLYGGTLIIGAHAEPNSLNLSLGPGMPSDSIIGQVYGTLIQWDAKMRMRPSLAESWTISNDGLTYTFKLVRNATFHDGHPFTSHDVKFSLEMAAKYRGVCKATFARTGATVECPDDYTAVFKLRTAYPGFIYSFGSYDGMIFPKHIYDGTDYLTNPNNWAPVGTGPFKFVSWKKGESIELVKNEKYFKKGKPYLDKIIAKIIVDPTTRTRALEAGEIDFVPLSIPLSDRARLDANPNIVTTLSGNEGQGRISYMAFNTQNKYLKDIRVRQAIAQAVDKEAIRKLPAIMAEKTVGVFPISYPEANLNLQEYARDLKKANQLLDDAGFPVKSDGFRFNLRAFFSSDNTGAMKSAELFREQMTGIGLNIDLSSLEKAIFVQKWFVDLDFDLAFHQYGIDAVGVGLLAKYYDSHNILRQPWNNWGYNNSEVDRLIKEAYEAPSQTVYLDRVWKIQEILHRDLPAIYMYSDVMVTAYRAEYRNLLNDPWQFGQGFEDAFWTKGSALSPEAIKSAISDAEKQIESLKGQLYDVTAASKQIEQAKVALAAGNYAKASELARGITGLAQPPYALYGGIVLIIAAVVGVFAYKRKKSR